VVSRVAADFIMIAWGGHPACPEARTAADFAEDIINPVYMKTLLSVWRCCVIFAIGFWLNVPTAIGETQRTFASPKEAADALLAATRNGDKAALRDIFGRDCDCFLSGKDGQNTTNFQSFTQAAAQSRRFVERPGSEVILEIGPDHWPFPIPLRQREGRWIFDTEAGKEEILNRHIGSNELHAIGVCRACAHGANASKEDLSRLLMKARVDDPVDSDRSDPQTCHGYVFKTLEGGDATLLAYPVQWGQSGVMTFIVSSNGKVYQRDLGEKTTATASAMTKCKPNRKWKLVQEEGFQD
jgi:hypothetical protein